VYRAGADFALSISDISGEMLSARLLGRVARSRDEHRRVVRVKIRSGSDRTLRDMASRQRGCSVLAIERAGAFLPVTAESRIQADDPPLHLWERRGGE
jgi:Trk K+ transport system NAD-binding subunit